MASGFGTSGFRVRTAQENADKFRGYTRSALHNVGEFVVHYLSLWQMADTIVTGYEAARRLVRQLPTEWRTWGEKLLEDLTVEDSVTFARYIDFPRLVVMIVAQWATICSPPILLPDEPQWSPISLQQILRQTTTTEAYVPERGYEMGTTRVTPLRRDRDEYEASTSQVRELPTETIPPPVTATETTQPWRNTARMRVGTAPTFVLAQRTSDSEDSEEEDPEEDMDTDEEDPDEYLIHEPVRQPRWGHSNRDGDD